MVTLTAEGPVLSRYGVAQLTSPTVYPSLVQNRFYTLSLVCGT